MNKAEFLQELKNSLRNYRSDETESILRYYDELISDKKENGMNEYEAVTSLGSIGDITACVKAELVETRITEHNRTGNPVTTFLSLAALCTSPVLAILAFTFSIVYLTLFITFLAVGVGVFAGGIGLIAMTIVNAVYAFGQLGISGVLISLGTGISAAAALCLLGIMFYKLAILLIKWFLKFFAKIISTTKRRKLNEDIN